MPIGASKLGVLGAGLVPGGSVTFNSSGNWTVPPGVKKVSITGRGGTGNPGNAGTAGNPGTPGSGGAGGGGGTGRPASPIPSPSPEQFLRGGGSGGVVFTGGVNCPNGILSNSISGGQGGFGQGAPFIFSPNVCGIGGSGPVGNSGSGGSAGSAGSAGTSGQPSSGLGNTFPGGAGGNAGAAGNAGTAGSGGPAGTGGVPNQTAGGSPAKAVGQGGTGAGQGGDTNVIGGSSGGGGAGATNSGNPGIPLNAQQPTAGSPPFCANNYNPLRGIGGDTACLNIALNRPVSNNLYRLCNPPGWYPVSTSGGVGARLLLGGRAPVPGLCGRICRQGDSSLGERTGNPPSCSQLGLRRTSPATPVPTFNAQYTANQQQLQRSGSGGGGGGHGNTQAPGGGGGGRGNAGNAGGAGGAGGTGAAGTPATFNCVPVTPGGTAPITVASPGGQIVISWNPQ